MAAASVLAIVQLSGCAVRVRGKNRPVIKVDRTKRELILNLEQRTDEHESSGINQKDTSTIFEEEVRLEAQGDVFHPMLMTYLTSIGLGLSQQRFKSDEESSSDNGSLNSYRVNMNFLPLKPYPFNINASQADRLVPRRFRSPLRVKDKTTGFYTHLKVPDWPMTLSWSESEIKQDADLTDNEDLFDRNSERLSYSVHHDFSEQSKLLYRFDWNQLEQSGRSSNRDIDSKRSRLEHDYYFGSDQQHHLDSSLTYTEKEETFDSETLNWNESLILRHAENFSTFYNFFYSENTFADTTNESVSGTVGFNHRLYKNLVTTFNTFWTQTETGPTSETTTTGGNLRFDYTRNNPWGKIVRFYSAELIEEETDGEAGTGIVIDEVHVFTDPFDVPLDQRNIDVSTIIVTDITGLNVYTEGDDYTVIVIGDQVELDVSTLGMDLPNIVDGQTLLVDYQYQTLESRDEDSLRQRFKFEQQFTNGWSTYYSHDRRDQEVKSTAERAEIPDEFRTNTFGVSYRKTNYYLSAEHSRMTSSRNPSNTTRLLGQGSWALSPKSSFIARLSQSWIESTGTKDRETNVFKAEGEIKSRLNRHLSLNNSADWRDEDSTDTGRTQGLKLGSALVYEYRMLNVKAGWETNILKRSNTDTTGTDLYLRIVRRF